MTELSFFCELLQLIMNRSS